MTVIRAFADERGNREIGWDRWEDAFEGDDRQGLEEFWSRSGEREGVEQEIRSIWASRVGRQWKDGNEGEVVSVELEWVSYLTVQSNTDMSIQRYPIPSPSSSSETHELDPAHPSASLSPDIIPPALT